MERLVWTWILGALVVLAMLASVQANKSKRSKREAELVEDVHLEKSLLRTKRRNVAIEKPLSRVKRLDEEGEIKRYKRQKRHIELIKKALVHLKKRSVSTAGMRELLRVKRTKRDTDTALHRVKRGKSKSHQVKKRAKKSARKRTLNKRDIQLAKALLRRKRNERPQKFTSGFERGRPRTVKKDGKERHLPLKKHHVQRHKKSTNESGDKHKRSRQDVSRAKSKKRVKSSKLGKDLSRVKRQ